MATRKVRLGVTVGIPDPDKTVPEVKDAEGRTIRPAAIGVRYLAPGELVEIEAEEADRLEARFPYQPTIVLAPNAVPTKSVR